MSARTSHDSTSSPRWKAFFPIVDAVYVMLALSVCVLTGCAPLLVVCFLPFPVAETYPWLCVALALSAPGIAAAFAIYRDHPVLRPSHFAGVESGVGKSSSSSGEGVPEWVAAPYVEADAGVAVFCPFFAAYAKLWKRSLALSAASGMLLFVLSYDARLLAQVSWGGICDGSGMRDRCNRVDGVDDVAGIGSGISEGEVFGALAQRPAVGGIQAAHHIGSRRGRGNIRVGGGALSVAGIDVDDWTGGIPDMGGGKIAIKGIAQSLRDLICMRSAEFCIRQHEIND